MRHNAAMDALLTLPQFAAFLPAATLITLAPGPDNLMVLSLGMARGRAQGVTFGLGCALGCLNHTLLAALGVSAFLEGDALTAGNETIAATPALYVAISIALEAR